jgi:thymidylate synthase
MMVSAWNPGDMDDMALPPCHYGFQVYTRGNYLDLIWTQRSVDVFLGLPYDIAIYGLLLVFLAKGHGYMPGRLIGQFGDTHLYKNHIDQARLVVTRTSKELPSVSVFQGLSIVKGAGNHLFIPVHGDVTLNNYKPHPHIKAELSVGK